MRTYAETQGWLEQGVMGGVNYTGHVTRLMQDLVAKVPELSFINLDRVLVFARPGRSSADGAYASCHSLGLPTSDPGYFYWRDKRTGAVTRRTEWFVTKSPEVWVDGKQMRASSAWTRIAWARAGSPRPSRSAASAPLL